MIRSLHHVGIAVEDLDVAIDFYLRTFGLEVEPVSAPPGSLLRFALIRLPGAEIELMASEGAETPVARFIARRGPGLHHLAFAVDEIGAAMAEAARRGVAALDPQPAPGVDHTLTCFFHPKATQGVLFEYVQPLGRREED